MQLFRIIHFFLFSQEVLNEVETDRGPSPYLSNIDLYLYGKLITLVQVRTQTQYSIHLQYYMARVTA